MTHKERLLALLKDFGVEADDEPDTRAGVSFDVVTIEGQKGGAGGFLYLRCEFVFNGDGSFRAVGVWE